MQTRRVLQTIEKKGELKIQNLPVEKGQQIEAYLYFTLPSNRAPLTAQQLLSSELIGMWENRHDIKNSSDFARQLRDQAQYRHRIHEDPNDYSG